MEREPQVAYPAVLQRRLRPVEEMEAEHLLIPGLPVQSVEEVEVHIVHLQPFQLLVQVGVEVLSGLDEPYGRFRRQPDLLPVPVREYPPEDDLALAVVVRVGRVDVVDPLVNRVADHPGRFVLDDVPAHGLPIGRGEAHGTEAEGGYLPVEFPELPELHMYITCCTLSARSIPSRGGCVALQ